eukprot:s1373_g4.t1
MSDPPESLLQGQGWAKKAVAFVKALPTSVADALLWSPETIPTTSLFSGACYPERALHYIDSARCPIRKGFLDLSASMCIAYSSLGNGEGGENSNGRLLIIYMMYHFRKGTPVLTHENVPGFETDKMKDTAETYGYKCVSVWCKPMDVNFHVGRPRK